MPTKIISIYCFFDELLTALGHKDDPQARLSTAEIMTVATVAAECFMGNQQAALDFLISHGYTKPFSKSRFNRRLHAVPEALWQFALFVLAHIHQQTNPEKIHLMDTFPVPVCRNIRIKRCKIYKDTQAHRGYCASKKEYFYGLKVCLITTQSGQPVELVLVPGATADPSALRAMDLNLPEASWVLADGGFLDRPFENDAKEQAQLHFVVPRRKNMVEQLPGWLEYLRSVWRKRVETTFSQLAERFSRSIHAVTARGFELKVFLTILAFSIAG